MCEIEGGVGCDGVYVGEREREREGGGRGGDVAKGGKEERGRKELKEGR